MVADSLILIMLGCIVMDFILGFFNDDTIVVIVALVVTIVILYAMNASYYNGVNDGYGYSQERNNPGYQKAGQYLRRYGRWRWPELDRPDDE